jgi:hypothetical protein
MQHISDNKGHGPKYRCVRRSIYLTIYSLNKMGCLNLRLTQNCAALLSQSFSDMCKVKIPLDFDLLQSLLTPDKLKC